MTIETHVTVTPTVNGEPRPVAVAGRTVLLHTLRDQLGLTGTKQVCEMGNCGACTVVLDDVAVYSCLVLTAECDGRRVDTVESLSAGPELSALQQAFVACDALQCGFCTPGQLMSLEAVRRSSSAPTDAEVVEALEGNLCRCGAYRHLLEAAEAGLGVDR